MVARLGISRCSGALVTVMGNRTALTSPRDVLEPTVKRLYHEGEAQSAQIENSSRDGIKQPVSRQRVLPGGKFNPLHYMTMRINL